MHITKHILMCTSVTHPKKQLQFIRVFAMVCKKTNPLCMTECYAIFLYVKRGLPMAGSPYSQSMLFILHQSAVSPPFCVAETISRTSLSSSFSTVVSACWLKCKKTSV